MGGEISSIQIADAKLAVISISNVFPFWAHLTDTFTVTHQNTTGSQDLEVHKPDTLRFKRKLKNFGFDFSLRRKKTVISLKTTVFSSFC